MPLNLSVLFDIDNIYNYKDVQKKKKENEVTTAIHNCKAYWRSCLALDLALVFILNPPIKNFVTETNSY